MDPHADTREIEDPGRATGTILPLSPKRRRRPVWLVVAIGLCLVGLAFGLGFLAEAARSLARAAGF